MACVWSVWLLVESFEILANITWVNDRYMQTESKLDAKGLLLCWKIETETKFGIQWFDCAFAMLT